MHTSHKMLCYVMLDIRVLRYLKFSLGKGIYVIKSFDQKLSTFVDDDW